MGVSSLFERNSATGSLHYVYTGGFPFFGTCRLGFSDHLFDVSSVLGSQGDSYIKHVFNLMERVLMLWIAGVTRA